MRTGDGPKGDVLSGGYYSELMGEKSKGWTAHWTDDDTGERLSEYIGDGHLPALLALSKHIVPNAWGMCVVRAKRKQIPDFILQNGSKRVRLMIA